MYISTYAYGISSQYAHIYKCKHITELTLEITIEKTFLYNFFNCQGRLRAFFYFSLLKISQSF